MGGQTPNQILPYLVRDPLKAGHSREEARAVEMDRGGRANRIAPAQALAPKRDPCGGV